MQDKSKQSELSERIRGIIAMQSCATDPNGSYTGVPENSKEKPIQDADDL